MAYLHCHSCGWSQDDFWNFKINFKSSRPFGYNPLSIFIEDYKSYFNLKFRNWDRNFVLDNPEVKAHKNENGTYRIRNIRIWILETKRNFKRIFNQKWWTYKSWKKNKDKAKCPKCGEHNFDID